MSGPITEQLREWLAASASDLDLGIADADGVLPQLAGAGLVQIGIPRELGGSGGSISDAVAAIAGVARESLAAAFMLWGQRVYAELLVHTDSEELRRKQLPDILAGRIAGASGLSNILKSLDGLEPLKVTTRAAGDDLVVNGKFPWVTNLRKAGFHVAVAADRSEGGPARIVALSHDDPGLRRSSDLDLMGMRSSDTASLVLSDVTIPAERILFENAEAWLVRLRPAVVALQCGMSIGIAERALDEAAAASGTGREVLGPDIDELRGALDRAVAAITSGLRDGLFAQRPAALLDLRIRLAEIVTEAVGLELQAGGGRLYLRQSGRGFARRWREAALIPVITPSVVQLRRTLAGAKAAA